VEVLGADREAGALVANRAADYALRATVVAFIRSWRNSEQGWRRARHAADWLLPPPQWLTPPSSPRPSPPPPARASSPA
jgi:hypothetical protein